MVAKTFLTINESTNDCSLNQSIHCNPHYVVFLMFLIQNLLKYGVNPPSLVQRLGESMTKRSGAV